MSATPSLFHFFTLFVLSYSAGTGIPTLEVDRDEERLMYDLFRGYKPELRPVLHKKDNITVKLGISLHQIIDMQEKNQMLKTSLWVRQSWHNPFLMWNASQYGGISSINVDAKRVWTPDIFLYNNADERDDGAMDRFNTKIVLSANGRSQWLAPVILSSSCKIDVKYFPFDQQACELKFGSWTYDGFKLDIIQEGPFADTNKYVKNGEWDLVSFPAKRHVLYYVCCAEPYPDVTFILNIRRRSTYYYINIIIPCILITSLTLLSFYLPPDSGERITLAITNLLALTVFMLLVAEIMPSTSEVVPLISIYYTCTIMEVGVALVATCIVLKFYFHHPEVSDMSPWIRIFILGWLARLLRIDVIGRKREYRRRSSSANSHCKQDMMDNNIEANILAARDGHFNKNYQKPDKESVILSSLNENTFDLKPNGNLCNGDAKKPRCESATSLLSSHNAAHMRRRDPIGVGPEDMPWLNTHANKHCRCDIDEPMVHVLSSQSMLLSSVNRLVRNHTHKESLDEQKYEWILAANVIDRAFFIMFLILILLSSFIIFSQGMPN